MTLQQELERLKGIALKATKVVAWYPHGNGDQCKSDHAQDSTKLDYFSESLSALQKALGVK